MAAVGSQENPLRVAIIGSGPSGFYTVSNLLNSPTSWSRWTCLIGCPRLMGWFALALLPTIKKTRALRVLTKKRAHPGFRFWQCGIWHAHPHGRLKGSLSSGCLPPAARLTEI